jgi:leucyl-tRNA synthetase
VSENIDAFHMNKAVAKCRELFNAVTAFKVSSETDKWVLSEAVEYFIQMIAPMVPHLAEELWNLTGHETLVAQAKWPAPDKSLLQADTITIGVQVNGKLRATITLPKDADKSTTEEVALNEPGVKRALDGKEIRKIIVVPGRIVNVVVG